MSELNELFAADVRMRAVTLRVGNERVLITPISPAGIVWVDAQFPGNRAEDWAYGGILVLRGTRTAIPAALYDAALDAGLTVETVDEETGQGDTRDGDGSCIVRAPTLYFDSLRGLIPLRRARTSVNSLGVVSSVVASDTGVYRAGESIRFGWTALVFRTGGRYAQLCVMRESRILYQRGPQWVADVAERHTGRTS
jgi:hypothetical protein